MPYWRVSDDAGNHPKFVGLSDRAFRLWFVAQCWSQEFLTDGVLPREAVKGMRYYSQARVRELLAVAPGQSSALWTDEGDHYRVHDYLEHNDSKATVSKRRQDKRARIEKWRERHGTDASRNASRNALQGGGRSASHNGVPHPHPQVDTKNVSTKALRAGARGPSFVFRGQRLEVSERMLETLLKPLGSAAEAVDWLDEFKAWDLDAVRADDPIENPLPWLRRRILSKLGLSDTKPARTAEPTPAYHETWSEECARVHGGSCGDRNRHRLEMFKTREQVPA